MVTECKDKSFSYILQRFDAFFLYIFYKGPHPKVKNAGLYRALAGFQIKVYILIKGLGPAHLLLIGLAYRLLTMAVGIGQHAELRHAADG